MPTTAETRTAEASVDTTRRQTAATPTRGDADAGNPAREESPKLPHERDQSVDMTHGRPDPKMEQAHEDVARGLQDTDRGPPADKAYQKQKQ